MASTKASAPPKPRDHTLDDEMNRRSVMRTLIPGTVVDLSDLMPGLTVTVYPAGWAHLVPFGEAIQAVAGRFVAEFKRAQLLRPFSAQGYGESEAEQIRLRNDRQEAENGWLRAAAQAVLPTVMGRMQELVAQCVVFSPSHMPDGGPAITVDDLLMSHVPTLCEAWVLETFGSEVRRRPWVAAIERAVAAATGKRVPMSEMLSKLSSLRDTVSKTSSIGDNPDSRTADGVSPSSDSGATAPEPTPE